MIRKILLFALQQRWMVIVVTLLMAIYGALVYERLPIQAFPDVENVNVVLISQYPNQSPEEVEKLVSMPIERTLNGIPHLMNVRSISMFGLSVVTASFDDHAEDYFSRQQVLERLQEAELPDGVQPVLGPLSTGIGEIYRYVVQSDDLPSTEIRALQEWVIEPYLKTAPGVADVSTFGGKVKQYQVNLDPERLRAFQLSVGEVMDALAANNRNTGGGILISGEQAMVVRGVGMLQTLEDIAEVVITRLADQTPVRVRDLGRIEIGHQEPTGIVGYNNQDDVTLGIVMMTKGADAIKVIEGINQRVAELNEVLLPPGTHIEMVNDRSELVSHTINTVSNNLLHGALLVVLVLMVFLMRPIAALLVAVIIPLSLLFAFILMNLNQVSANLISLGAIDFGIIVDSTVVLVEAVMVKLTSDVANNNSLLHRRQSIINVGSQMIRPILFAKLILIAAFLPVLTFSQVEGKIFSPMALTLTFALIGSVLLTLLLVPAMMSFFLDKRLTERHNPMMQWLYRRYRQLLTRILQTPKAFIGLLLVVLAFGFYSVKHLGTEFMPKFDEGNIWLTVELSTSSSLAESKSVERQVREVLMSFPEVELVVSHLGRPEDGTDSKGFNSMEIHVELAPKETWRFATRNELTEAIKDKISLFPGLTFNFSQQIQASVEEAISGSQGEIVVKLYGLDLPVMQQKADQIVSILNHIQGSADVAAEQQMGLGEAQFVINRGKAALHGVSVDDISNEIEAALGGGIATEILEGERRFDLQVRLMSEGRDSIAAMQNILIPTMDGRLIPLAEVVDVHVKTGANRISRESNYRRITVKSNLIDRDQGSFVEEAMQKVAAEVDLPAGYRIEWSGEFENQQRAMKRLYVIVPISLLLIFGLLFWAFNSAAQALLVMLTVPFALIGGVWLLWSMSIHLSISAAVGFIVLFGIAVQNGVVLLEQINHLRNEGEALKAAIMQGAGERLRPVLMTALMAILGLLPAAVSTGVGAEATRPFALAIVGGLVTATLATLTLLPVLYWLMFRKQDSQ